LSQSIGLLGKTVNVNLEQGSASGTVIAMSLVNGQPQLTISQENGSLLRASPTQVSTVIELGGR